MPGWRAWKYPTFAAWRQERRRMRKDAAAGSAGGGEELLSHTTYRYRKYSFGDRLIETIVDPGGANLATGRFYYETGTSAGLVKQINNADGSWRRFEYDSSGRTLNSLLNNRRRPDSLWRGLFS